MSMQIKFTYNNREPEVVVFSGSPLMIGRLLSNAIILPIDGVEPIHALIEASETDGTWRVTDLGSDAGVIVNGKKISVVATFGLGAKIQVGAATLIVEPESLEIPEPIPGKAPSKKPLPPPKGAPSAPSKTPSLLEKTRQSLLFSPRSAKPTGDVLEVVAYWGNTILEVEQFHPSYEGHENVYVGDPLKSHFIAAGPENLSRHKLANVGEDGYRLNLVTGMIARLRKGGEIKEVEGGSHVMNRRDIAHIRYGAVSYFFLFIRPPEVVLPKMGLKDPFFVMLLSVFLTFFVVSTTVLWLANPSEKKNPHDDLWGLVHTLEEKKKPEKKKEVEIQKVTVPPPPELKPPPPKPEKVKPVKPVEPPKPKEPPKPAEKPQMTEVLKRSKEAPKLPKAEENQVAKGNVGGAAKSAAQTPKASGAIKGNTKQNIKGVAGASSRKPSGVNLNQLGIGVGAISSNSGPSAIHTNFKSSAGGAGGGMGSASQTLGFGGGDSSAHSLALSGSGGGNNFGSGNGVLGGRGAQGSPFGKGKTNAAVNVGTGDPLISGGLSEQEIMGVIRANLNQVRHCYEALLQRSPNASGVMKVHFVIGLDGFVKSARKVSSSLNDGGAEGCVLGVIRTWKFNQPRGNSPVNVNYPFSFNPV